MCDGRKIRWLTILFSARHHGHVLCFLVGGSANRKREKRRRGRKRKEGEDRRRKERKVRSKGDSP